MTLPVWAADPESLLLTQEQYEELPEHVRRMIEVIDNHVVFLQSGSVEHSRVARRFVAAFEAARPPVPCISVSTDVDMYYAKRQRDAEGNLFSFRRPDITVHRCLERGAKLGTRSVLIAIEVVFPGSETTDRVQKVAEYAREQIPVYLVVTLDDRLYVRHVVEYRLDWSRRAYQQVAVHDGEVVLSDPFPFAVRFAELDQD